MPQAIVGLARRENGLSLFSRAAAAKGCGRRIVFWTSLLCLAAGIGRSQTANHLLNLQIKCDPVPPGGWAQIKIYAASPQQITTANLSMDLDSSFFGGISNVAVFSATGDAAGYAHVSGNHVDGHFSSGSGGIGQLPGLPMFAISVPLLAGLVRDATTVLTLDMKNSSFGDAVGSSYSIAVAAATAQTRGAMSVQSVFPAGGVVPAGGVIQIGGTGFDPSTRVTIDGVSIASTQLVSPQQINITLGGAAEMTGKCFRLTNSGADHIDFFAAMPSAIAGGSTPAQPLLPLTTYQLVQWTYPIAHPTISQFFALQNSTTAPVTATFFNAVLCKLGTYTIPPGALYLADYNAARINSGVCSSVGTFGDAATLYMITSAPIRMLAYQSVPQNCTGCSTAELTFPPIPMASLPAPSNFFTIVPFSWNYQIGQSAPAPLALGINANIPISVSVSPSASQWLAASVAQSGASENPIVRLTPSVMSLAPGVYTGAVTVTTSAPLPSYLSQYSPPSATYPVTLKVSAAPLVSFAAAGPGASAPWWQTATPGYSGPYPTSVPVQSTSDPAPFTATATTTGGNWLLVTPSKGVTPASVNVDVKEDGLAPGIYSGQVTVQGPDNSLSFSASLNILPPIALSFVMEAGASMPANSAQTVIFSSALGSISTFSIQTQSGGNWLYVTTQGLATSSMQVIATATGLGPGAYKGTITVNGSKNSAQVPVTLTVLGSPKVALTATPASLSLTAAPGQVATQSLALSSPGGAVVFRLNACIYPIPASGAGTNPLASLEITPTSVAVPSTPSLANVSGAEEVNPSPTPVAPTEYQVKAGATQPGTYYGSIAISWDGGSLTVPITLSVTAAPGFPPIMANLVNAASQATTALAPGEIISIFGTGLGGQPVNFTLDAKGNLPTIINGTQVLINGQPAPLLYVSGTQINAIVPYEVGAAGAATIQVVSNGLPSATWSMPVAPAAPGIFTTGGGIGQAAALNQDGSLNNASNPAGAGTVVTLFATGCGQTAPAGITGSLAPLSPSRTVLPVTVTIGGIDAPVQYSGSAPGEVAGLIQINAVVPPGVTPGPAVPVVIKVGGAQSPSGVTIAVQ
jgi:uncharacterized protein (TIGR03437 family)